MATIKQPSIKDSALLRELDIKLNEMSSVDEPQFVVKIQPPIWLWFWPPAWKKAKAEEQLIQALVSEQESIDNVMKRMTHYWMTGEIPTEDEYATLGDSIVKAAKGDDQ